MANPLFSYENKKYRRVSKWTLGLLGGVIVIALLLRVVDALRPEVVPPTSDVDAVSYEDIQNGGQGGGQGGGVTEPDPEPNPDPEPETPPPAEDPATPDTDPEPPADLQAELNLSVPFVSQAPFGVWDPMHEETCEEASFLMALDFYAGKSSIDATEADNKYYDMVAVQETLGMGLSITAAEAKEFVKHYFNEEVTIYDNPTVDEIKALVAAGKPVIVPAAGRKLGNPFFTGAGPLYHMLVIRGYTETGFITNDPGTRHGQNYTYDIDVLMAAIGDWNNGDPEHGAKRVFVIEP